MCETSRRTGGSAESDRGTRVRSGRGGTSVRKSVEIVRAISESPESVSQEVGKGAKRGRTSGGAVFRRASTSADHDCTGSELRNSKAHEAFQWFPRSEVAQKVVQYEFINFIVSSDHHGPRRAAVVGKFSGGGGGGHEGRRNSSSESTCNCVRRM
jgi:hypothetical protein